MCRRTSLEPSSRSSQAELSVRTQRRAVLTTVGALIAGQTADRIGRKRTIQLGSVIAIIGRCRVHKKLSHLHETVLTSGCSIQTGAINVGMLIAGRFIAGLSIGVLSMIVPVYQAEISPPHARGLLSGWTQLMIVWGFFIANWCVISATQLTSGSVMAVSSSPTRVNGVFLWPSRSSLPSCSYCE